MAIGYTEPMDFSALFYQDNSFSFLNAGTLSRTPLAVLEHMEKVRRADERNPTFCVFDSPRLLWSLQQQLGPFLGARPEDIFLRSNITTALNDFFFGLELGEGEILASGMEYGATANLAKVRATQIGMSFRAAPLPLGPEVTEEALFLAIVEAMSPDTRLLLLSHVITGTGTILPIARIAAEAKKRDVIVVVDGAHGVGALPLDLSSLGVDFYGGNFHKWFMGPKGTAFGWVNPETKAKIEWKFGGWSSFGVPEHYGDVKNFPKAAVRMFPGTMDTSPFTGLGEVLDFWHDHGPDKIHRRQRDLRDYCAEIATSFGWQRLSPLDKNLLGPLVSFALPESWPKLSTVGLATRIYNECALQIAIPVVQGQPVLRFSPGVYCSESEIEVGLHRLKGWK